MPKFWDFTLVMITTWHCLEKKMTNGWKRFKFRKGLWTTTFQTCTWSSRYNTLKLSFSTFAKMKPSNYVLTSIMNQRSGLCTKHQNVTLKLKMLKYYDKTVQINPDAFIKTFSSGDIKNLLDSCEVNSHDYEEWQKVDVKVKRDQERWNKEKKWKLWGRPKTKPILRRRSILFGNTLNA